MRRLLRWLFNGLTVLSLLQCVATIVLWAWSSRRWVSCGRERTTFPANGEWQRCWDRILCREGRIIFGRGCRISTRGTYVRFDEDKPAKVKYGGGYVLMDSMASIDRPDGRVQTPEGWNDSHAFAGFFRHRGEWREQVPPVKAGFRYGRYADFGVPFWFLALLFGAAPAAKLPAFVRRLRGRSRRLAGLCPACGYDLRASPDRCPECGTVVNTKVRA